MQLMSNLLYHKILWIDIVFQLVSDWLYIFKHIIHVIFVAKNQTHFLKLSNSIK